MKSKSIVVLGLIFGTCLALPTIPDLYDFDALIERCNGKGNGAVEKIKAAKDETQICLENLIDIDVFKNELEEANKTYTMDEVFYKYCNKGPQFIECLQKPYNAVKPCLQQNETDAISLTFNILQQLGDFSCFKKGYRLALFVMEGGVDCLKSRSHAVQNCVNSTIKFNYNTFSRLSLPNLLVTEKDCNDLGKIQSCVVNDMDIHCKLAPTSIIDALFRYFKKLTCKN